MKRVTPIGARLTLGVVWNVVAEHVEQQRRGGNLGQSGAAAKTSRGGDPQIRTGGGHHVRPSLKIRGGAYAAFRNAARW